MRRPHAMSLRLRRTPLRRKSGALLRSKASADLPGVDMIEGDPRNQGTLTCSLVVKGAESPRLMHDPGGGAADAAR